MMQLAPTFVCRRLVHVEGQSSYSQRKYDICGNIHKDVLHSNIEVWTSEALTIIVVFSFCGVCYIQT